VVAHHEAQNLAGWNTENALLRVELPAVDPEVSEGLGKVGDEVVFVGGLDHHIVDVGLDVLADLRL
jgi:hypothetical protein